MQEFPMQVCIKLEQNGRLARKLFDNYLLLVSV